MTLEKLMEEYGHYRNKDAFEQEVWKLAEERLLLEQLAKKSSDQHENGGGRIEVIAPNPQGNWSWLICQGDEELSTVAGEAPTLSEAIRRAAEVSE